MYYSYLYNSMFINRFFKKLALASVYLIYTVRPEMIHQIHF